MKTLTYYGAANFNEYLVTGRVVTWTQGQTQSVDDSIAAKLVAYSASFSYKSNNPALSPLTDEQVAAGGTPAVVRTDANGKVLAIVNDDGTDASIGGSGGDSSIITLTTSRSLANTDNGNTLVYSGSTDIVLTVPTGLTSGFSATIVQQGSGKVSLTQGAGVGFDNIGSTRGTNTFTTIMQVSTNQYGFQNPVPTGPVTYVNTGLPVGMVSSWTFGANGALTVGAINNAYPNCFLYFPADAIATGVPAGLYYTEFSNTTTGVVYNNRATTLSELVVPAAKTAFVTSAGSVTAQVTATTPMFSTTIPGGALGKNGRIRGEFFAISNNSANTKTASITLGSSSINSSSMSGSNIAVEAFNIMQNTGVNNRQVSRNALVNSTTGTPTFSTIDTSTDQTVAFNLHLPTAATGDYVFILRAYASVEFGA